jgi:hypothetical protein
VPLVDKDARGLPSLRNDRSPHSANSALDSTSLANSFGLADRFGISGKC